MFYPKTQDCRIRVLASTVHSKEVHKLTHHNTDPDFWAAADHRPTIKQSVWYGFMRLLKLAGLAH